ncbi:EAL domain-containing protein [Chitinimonas arctica]|uniref:EAL domain-containing protein n=1 Tax=Chitinimonas arctica TaxID=2594795 RepID=A0A516SGT3_9NEIS|nr:EAL domain-containing protein [Chitinimonas arctica]QDQ27379.1 EAL domain-containing protein [Chitinimonas arctica]
MDTAANSGHSTGSPLARGRHWLSRLSLRQVFVLVVAVGLLVPGVLFTLLMLDWRRDELTRQFRTEQERVLETLALGLRQPLWDLSLNAGQPLVDTAMKDPRIVSVRVDGSFPGEPFISIIVPERRQGRAMQLSRPVHFGDQIIGKVLIEFDDGDLRRRLAAQAREYVLLIGVELVVSLLLILLLLDSRFLGPLRRLIEQAKTLTDHEAVAAAPWVRDDEIGDLGRQLEWARSELHRLFGELNDKNDALELDIVERMQTEEALRASEAKYRELFLSNLDGICVTDMNGLVLDANPALLALLDVPAEALVGKQLVSFVAEAWRNYDDHMIQHRVLVDGHCGEYEIELYRPGDGLLPVSAKGVLMRDVDARPIGVWRILRDLTERKAAALRMELAAKVFDNTAEAIMVIAPDNHIASVNRAFTEMLGYATDEIVGQPSSVMRDATIDPEVYENINRQYINHGAWQGEVPFRRKSGETFTAWAQINVVRDVTGRIGDVVALIRDISDAKQAQERILHLARFDALTQLPNRAYFRELAEEAIAEAHRHHEHRALLFVDLDHFKTINDSLGHDVGDQLLKEVAGRLHDALRAGDVVGRLGGDEFVVLLRNLDEGEDASYVANRMLARLAQPFQLNEHELVVTPSLGISLYPVDGEDYDTLVRNADAAMYHAKENGRNTYRFYTADMNARALEILSVENQLRRALERDEFVLHYQPQVDMGSGRIVGVEALIRWRHPERGLVGPMQFIPIAEERGLIGAIGQWVLREACRQNQAWQAEGLPPIEVAVNLSAMQFYGRDLAQDITAILAETGLAPRWLALEVTESVIVQDVESTIATLAALKGMGLKLAIDDFGTGYSSLSYLKRFKVDKLKVDRSFVMDVPGDADDSAITRAIVNLARNLGLQVIAEGVETPEQWSFLKNEGCDEVQGYLISPPLPAEDLAKRLARGAWRLGSI